MRTILLFAIVSCLISCVYAAPLCPSLPVALELRQSPTTPTGQHYQLVFAAADPQAYGQQAEFVDIHYRVNNEDSINLRVLTEAAITSDNQPGKQAQVDGIRLLPGDALRAYATYSSKGYACDTPIHTFSAPERMNIDMEDIDNIWTRRSTPRRIRNEQTVIRTIGDANNTPFRTINTNTINRVNPNSAVELQRRLNEVDSLNEMNANFWAQSVLEEQGAMCPSIPLDQDVVKIAELDNTYVISFENKNPMKQLHYVDLHLSTDPAKGWDNLRLGSDMQLHNAHRVIQPGVVIKPYETLQFYWSYRTTTTDGQIVDCTTPITSMLPQQVTHEITLKELKNAALTQ